VIYKVIIQPPAESDIDLAYRYIAQYSTTSADRWFNGLYDAIMSLRTMPNRCGLARESGSFDEPIRQLIYGRRSQAYRVIFVVRDRQVRVLRVLHGAHDQLRPGDLRL
jgi:plasmid stabilization system protein ParE